MDIELSDLWNLIASNGWEIGVVLVAGTAVVLCFRYLMKRIDQAGKDAK